MPVRFVQRDEMIEGKESRIFFVNNTQVKFHTKLPLFHASKDIYFDPKQNLESNATNLIIE